jgi:hypothetical protein
VADPILGFGTTLEVDRGAGYVEIVKLTEIGEFGGEGDDVEVTTHDSGDNNGFRSFIRGLQDPGEVSLTGLWVGDATTEDLMNDSLAGAFTDSVFPYRIVLPSGLGTFVCNGYMRGFRINPQMDGRLEWNGTLRLSGQPTFAVTESTGLTTPFFVVTPDAGAAATYVPARSGSVYDYVVTVGTTAAAVTVTPTATAGVITVNGTTVATGVASASIALGAAGSVTIITVQVKETDKVAKVYTLRVTRP